jgi:ABC-2 type transport system permease protein
MTAYVLTDTSTMLRRSLRRMRRYPSLTIFSAAMPVAFLLLFVYVFGGTLGAGLPSMGVSSGDYLAFVVPGILALTVVSTSTATAISVAMDMQEGIIARFRTMAISRTSVLTGHIVGSVFQTLIAVALVFAVALLIGYRPNAGPVELLAAMGVIAIGALAVTCLSVVMGLVANSVESASNMPVLLLLLPLIGSGFVPTESMPGPLQVFADNQPFTPIVDTVRGLMTGTDFGSSGLIALAWGVGLSLAGFLWARHLYNRIPERI